VPRDTDQVTIEPNGKWSRGNKNDSQTPRNSKAAHDTGSDDDIIEITDYRVTNIKSEAAMHTPLSATRTPPLSSRDSSTAPRTGSKRKSEVIDLTLSDDDEPPRPAKKVSYNTPSSLPDSSFRNRVPTFGNPAPSLAEHPQLQSHSLPPQPQSIPSFQPQPLHPLNPGVRIDLRGPLTPGIPTPYGAYRAPQTRPGFQPAPGGYGNLGP
jgi:E3 SUMO-protein ligase PIAS1